MSAVDSRIYILKNNPDAWDTKLRLRTTDPEILSFISPPNNSISYLIPNVKSISVLTVQKGFVVVVVFGVFFCN